MSIRHLKTFVAIAEHGTFGAAADIMCITNSAVSMQMKALEKELRVSLFDRTKRPPSLNIAGYELMGRAKKLIKQYDELESALSSQNDIAGHLRVGAVPTTLTGIMPQALSALKTEYPKLHVIVSSGLSAELATQLGRGHLDAALISEPEYRVPGTVWTPVACEQLSVIASMNAPENTARELLQSHPFLRFSRSAWVGMLIENALTSQKIRVRDEMELNSLESISVMVYHGLGVSIVPDRCVVSIEDPPLKRIPFGKTPIQRIIGLIYPSDSFMEHHIQTLIAKLQNLGGLIQRN
jgi:DNA-binding transcriptional LysR family regulator